MADQGGSGGAEAASVVVPTAGKPMELRRLLILAAGTTAVVGLVFIGGMWLWREANKKRGKKPTKNSRKKPSEQAGKSRHATDYDKDNQPEDQAGTSNESHSDNYVWQVILLLEPLNNQYVLVKILSTVYNYNQIVRLLSANEQLVQLHLPAQRYLNSLQLPRRKQSDEPK